MPGLAVIGAGPALLGAGPALLLLGLSLLAPGDSRAQSADCRPPASLDAFTGRAVDLDPDCREEAGHAYAYHWNTGDGSGDGSGPWSDSPRLSFTYAQAGLFVAILKVEVDGVWLPANTFSVPIQVRTPVTAGSPSSSATLACDRGRGRVWNVNADQGTVTECDGRAGERLREIAVGGKPKTLALDPEGNVWVTVRKPASLVRIDRVAGATRSVPLPYGSLPYGVVIDGAARLAYVSLEATGRVARVDLAAFSVTASAAVFPTPRALALSHDGKRLFVARFHTRAAPALPPDSAFGEVAELSAPELTVTHRIRLPYDRSVDSRLGGAGVITQLRSLVIDPGGKKAWVAATKANVFRGRFLSGADFDPSGENSLRAVVAVLDLDARKEDLDARFDLDDSGMPSAVAFTSDGVYGLVATQGTSSVEILAGGTPRDMGTIGPAADGPGLAPDGLALSGGDSLLFVHNFTTRTLGIYDRTRPGATGGLLQLKTVPLVASDPLTPRQLRGLQLFYNSADARITKSGYIACASCHLEDGSDRLVWDFTERGEGLRRTIPLLGRGGTGHGPVHWSANFDEIQDFEHDMRGPFAGSGLMADADFLAGTRNTALGDPKAGRSPDLDALADYVSTLTAFDASPYRNPDGGLTADALAGREIFRRPEVGCARCHAGPDYTDSDLRRPFVLHDVGTLSPASGKRMGDSLTGLDTPTLLGIWQFPPYLHDGSAATLMDVLTTRNRDDRHGKTSGLSELEKGRLVAFLQQLEGPEAGTDRVRFPEARTETRGGGAALRAARGDGWLELRLALPPGLSRPILTLSDVRGGKPLRLVLQAGPGGYRGRLPWLSSGAGILGYHIVDRGRRIAGGVLALP